MILLDGSQGEGGGQILRTALSLSSITGQSFKIDKIRLHRSRPGLLSQHLTCVKAAAELCSAEISGARKGSTGLVFQPGPIRGGSYRFAVRTAGSALLVFQTVFPILSWAAVESEIVLSGGTHNPKAPPYDFIERIFLPCVEDLGFRADLNLQRHGFFPRGGGIVRARIFPRVDSGSLELLERGRLKEVRPSVLLADLSPAIAQREARVLGRGLNCSSLPAEIRTVPPGEGPGNVVFLEAEYSCSRSLFTAFGMKGKRAESVAGEVEQQWKLFNQIEVPVQEELADQLLLPMGLAGMGAFLTGPLSLHAQTNIRIIQAFLQVRFEILSAGKGKNRIQLKNP